MLSKIKDENIKGFFVQWFNEIGIHLQKNCPVVLNLKFVNFLKLVTTLKHNVKRLKNASNLPFGFFWKEHSRAQSGEFFFRLG
jgi:hypothetical protein